MKSACQKRICALCQIFEEGIEAKVKTISLAKDAGLEEH